MSDDAVALIFIYACVVGGLLVAVLADLYMMLKDVYGREARREIIWEARKIILVLFFWPLFLAYFLVVCLAHVPRLIYALIRGE